MRRRRRAVSAVVLLLLMQIFSGVDWNCPSGFCARCCDDNCRAEHRAETTCQPDADSLLAAAWLQIHEDPAPMFSVSEPGKNAMASEVWSMELRRREVGTGLPPEEPVPLRC